MFDAMIDGFDDLLVIGKSAKKYEPAAGETMERMGDRVWINAPMISASYDGFDQTSNFGDVLQMAVPITVGFHKSANFRATAKNLRNQRALTDYGQAAKQKLASDINFALFQTAALQGSVFVKRTVAPTGYDDVALADAALTEIGVPLAGRKMFLAPRVANFMAGNLASRAEDTTRSRDAYERAMIRSDVAGFEVFKNDQSIRLAAASGGATTVNGANQFWVPAATTTAAGTGQTDNLDNRYSTLAVTATTYANIKAGDAFTIAGVNSVHMITKQDTGQLQTFRVIGKPSAGTLLVAPAIISAQGATKPEVEYKNVTATPANAAAITWLNTTTAEVNPFFVKDSLLLIPGSYQVDSEVGWSVMRATTDLGIAITYTRQGEINDLTVKGRWDIDFGTALLNPQMAGATAFAQA
jgi:hypothetical protein